MIAEISGKMFSQSGGCMLDYLISVTVLTLLACSRSQTVLGQHLTANSTGDTSIRTNNIDTHSFSLPLSQTRSVDDTTTLSAVPTTTISTVTCVPRPDIPRLTGNKSSFEYVQAARVTDWPFDQSTLCDLPASVNGTEHTNEFGCKYHTCIM